MTETNQGQGPSEVPVRYKLMLDDALCTVRRCEFRNELRIVASVVSQAAWRGWLETCGPEDNRQEHEWVVFANVMRIGEKENLDLSERRIAAAFAFMHDSHRITDRKMEADKPSPEEKAKQRREHMDGGADIANRVLRSLLRPNRLDQRLFEDNDVNRCVAIIRKHDSWKLDPPEPFPTNDTLAVVCVEADALWPLHPIGVLADIERANTKLVTDANKVGAVGSFASPWSWEAKLKESLATLTHSYRRSWEAAGIPKSDFQDRESIFRTEEGYRLYREWRIRWNV
jgi:hypothetical protein